MKICVPQSACAGIDHPTAGRIMARNGIMHVPDHVGRDLIKYDGCFAAADKPANAVGFTCTECGFDTYFRKRGRCGGTCVRPHELQEAADGVPQEA